MQSIHLLQTIQQFLGNGPFTAMEITFGAHQVNCAKMGSYLPAKTFNKSRILITNIVGSNLAQMLVMDTQMFYLPFQFAKPSNTEHYSGKMHYLPVPLTGGTMELNANELVLRFGINATTKAMQLQLTHSFSNPFAFEKIPSLNR